MSPREYLSQIRRLNVQIEIKIREKEDLEKKSSGVGGIDYAKDRVQTSPAHNAYFERNVDRIVEMEQHIDKMIDELYDLRSRIVGQILCLEDPRYISVLYLRYAEFKKITDISREMHYSYNHVVELHSEALEAFGKMYGLA